MTSPQHRAVVFGGSSGIGLATGRYLAGAGMTVTLVGRSEARLADIDPALPRAITVRACDASDDAAVATFFEDHDPFDHLIVSIAGAAALGPFIAISDKAFRGSLEPKFFAYCNVIRHGVGRLRSDGSITLVTGGSGHTPTPSATCLVAANAALEALVPTLALELAPIRVNAVAPGTTDTAAWQRIPAEMREKLFAAAIAKTPLGRVGTPDDMAAAVASIIQNTYMTGVVFDCDGGFRLT